MTTFRSARRSAAGAAGIAIIAVVSLSGCNAASSGSAASAGNSATAGSPPLVSSAATVAAAAPSTAASATSGGGFDSCSVVTEAQAASAMKESVSAGVLGTATVEGGLACVFYGSGAPSAKDPNVAQPDSVRVVVVEGPDAAAWYQDYKSSAKVHAQTINGYGDEAFYDGLASLSVMKGNAYIRIAVDPAGAAPSLSDEEKLMSAILPGI
ncbi:MAG TPA: hypothetical protein VGX23_18505 [Actinocrinis sp.]|nr:hypothetical protein [Actinocrinis sp.]